MNEIGKTLVVFENEEFGRIRTVEIDGEIWFVGKDVASALGYKDTVNSLKAHVEEEDKTGWQITTQFGEKEAVIINESGLFSLILSLKLESARKFKRWVTSDSAVNKKNWLVRSRSHRKRKIPENQELLHRYATRARLQQAARVYQHHKGDKKRAGNQREEGRHDGQEKRASWGKEKHREIFSRKLKKTTVARAQIR